MSPSETATVVRWAEHVVSSPSLANNTVIAALGIPYLPSGNRLQRLNVYLPHGRANQGLVGTPAVALPGAAAGRAPHIAVFVHGGAWRDPQLTATSVEAAVAHAFVDGTPSPAAVVAIDYTVSPFPTHPSLPYDPDLDDHGDPAREAAHPQHLGDVLRALAHLRTMGLTDDSYVLVGHSCGACIAAQAVFGGPARFGLDVADAPRPAAFVGLNGLYDLPALVAGLGPSHERLSGEYAGLLAVAFGNDADTWISASPALIDDRDLRDRVTAGKAPLVALLDQSTGDQLVPMNQTERFARRLAATGSIRLVDGRRATGRHAAPWQQGLMLWQSVQDALDDLEGN